MFDCIGFGLGSRLPDVSDEGARVDILFTIEENSWNGNVFPQLKLKDIRPLNEERTKQEILAQIQQYQSE